MLRQSGAICPQIQWDRGIWSGLSDIYFKSRILFMFLFPDEGESLRCNGATKASGKKKETKGSMKYHKGPFLRSFGIYAPALRNWFPLFVCLPKLYQEYQVPVIAVRLSECLYPQLSKFSGKKGLCNRLVTRWLPLCLWASCYTGSIKRCHHSPRQTRFVGPAIWIVCQKHSFLG